MKHRKILRRVLGTALAVASLASVSIPAGAIEIEMPEEPMSVESIDGTRYLTTTAQRASSEIPLILGINIVGGNILPATIVMAGTNVNDNPDPYVWNFNYLYPGTSFAGVTAELGERRAGTEDFDSDLVYEVVSSGNDSPGLAAGNGLYLSGGANQVMSTAVEEYGGVGYGVYKMIDVWIGFHSDVLEQIDFIQNEMDPSSEYYQEGYATYDPLITDVTTGTLTSRAYGWVEMGNALSAYLAEHPEYSVRYGDPQALCYNIQEYAFGIPYYIDALIASGKLTKITGAFISATSDDGLTFTLVDPGTLGSVQADCYAVGNTVNWLEGTYTMDQLKDTGVDIVVIYTASFGTSANSSGSRPAPGEADPSVPVSSGNNDSGSRPAPGEADPSVPVSSGNNDSGSRPAPGEADPSVPVSSGDNGDGSRPAPGEADPSVPVSSGGNGNGSGSSTSSTLTRTYLESLMEDVGYTRETAPVIIDAANESIGQGSGNGGYQPTPPLFVPYGIAYMYLEQLAALAASGDEIAAAINPTALLQFTYDEFYHIKDDSAYSVAAYYIGDNWAATDSDLDKVPATASGAFVYDKNAIVTAIQIGIQYALDNQDDESIYLPGAYREAETAYALAQMVVKSGVSSFAEILKAANGNYSSITYKDENNQDYGTYDVSALVEYYGIDGLAALVDDYVAHMDKHPWNPDTTVQGTYGYGMTKFTDVSADSTYAPAVAWALKNNIMTGTSDTTFSPNQTASRGDVVTFLYRAAGEPEIPAGTKNPFTDVKESDYYYDAVLWAVAEGITNGTSETTFSPEQTCSRAHVLTFLYRYEKEPRVSSASSFTDLTEEWYKSAIAWAVSEGIAAGTTATTFSPAADSLRSEFITFMYRVMA